MFFFCRSVPPEFLLPFLALLIKNSLRESTGGVGQPDQMVTMKRWRGQQWILDGDIAQISVDDSDVPAVTVYSIQYTV